ncbi:class I SAM-dependent methyltransferase [Prosthecobacter sp.]|uniref:class I SAM-dependent methyltransferase n=1 Tax=Prosthecobacter sp. TaxID=1965333 RepID=UPI00248A378E|nr:class I SAM-dependent methyltransferase [Prosthecobacter sp.]MDI1315162.1 class I SAM-dependent methyltransferase [Prosthecobacter sp.]
MKAPEYDLMRSVEDRHWWYAVLRSQVQHALAGRLPPGGLLLDAGCGTGGMLQFLQEQICDLNLAGVDAAEEAVRHCQQRGLNSVKMGSIESLPYADAAFDAVTCLDVLYHDGLCEERALAEMSRVLRPDGLLVLNLPAFAGLRGSHDVAVSGARRYAACQVRTLLERSSFAVEMIHYWNAWLFLPLLVWRRLSRMQPEHGESDLKLTPAWMNSLLTGVGRLDAGLCRELRLPFGSSVFAVARKRNRSIGGMHHGSN